MGKAGIFDEEYAIFERGDRCRHDKVHKTVIRIDWGESPMCSNELRYACNSVRAVFGVLTGDMSERLVSNTPNADLTHEWIGCRFFCSECNKFGYITMDFSPCGKRVRYGEYRSQFDKKIFRDNFPDNDTLVSVMEKFESTWPSQGASDYKFCTKNCKMFAEALWNAL